MDFTDDVPKCEVNSCNRRASSDTMAMPEMLPPHHLPKMLDASRVLADQQRAEILNRSNNPACVPFQCGFAPAKQPGLVGQDFDEDPIPHASMTDEGFNLGDFHLELRRRKGAWIYMGRGDACILVDDANLGDRART